jgi:hypothetical protein
MRIQLAFALVLAFAAGLHAQGSFKKAIPFDQMPQKLRVSYKHLDPLADLSAQERARISAGLNAGTLQTLPHWQGSFAINGTSYNYTIVGGDPQNGGATKVRTVIVPIKLTIPDYSADGKNPIVLDATPIIPQIIASPIFQVSDYISGYQQFTDAMLRTEFPNAAAGWHTVLSPVVTGATLDIIATPGSVTVFQSQSGNYLADVLDDHIFDRTFLTMLEDGDFPSDEYVIFISYNSVEHDAFGYHAAGFHANQTQENVFAYSSWLLGVDDLLSVPSPDAATLSHEVAETIHDAFIGNLTSLTLVWGDPFNHNKCFQNYIETGDAVEDAPAHIELHEQVVGFGSQAHVYTLQNEALLPWFERETPSDALAGAYSFPDIWVLTSAAPLTCVP